MLKFTLKIDGWEITEKGQVIFSKIGSLIEAVAIAKANDILLPKYIKSNKMRAA